MCFYRLEFFAVVFAGFILVMAGGCADEEVVANEERAEAVETAEVSAETFERRVRGVGTLRAKQSVEVTTEAEGVVEEILLREGEFVERDELLVVIRGEKLRRRLRSSEAALRGAKSELEYAERTYERFSELREDNAVSVEDYERQRAAFLSAEAAVDQLEADIALIEEQIEDTRVKAPFEGHLSARVIDIGDFVRPGQPLVRLFSRKLEMRFALPERYIGQVEHGQPVEIMVGAYPEKHFDADITFISPDIDEGTRNFMVKAEVANEEGLLKPGGFATAVVIVEVLEEEPAVPEKSLIGTRVGYMVFVIENDRAYRREVEVGLRRPGIAQIVEGVSVGEQVVTAGHMDLRDGESVRIVEESN